VAIKKPPPFRFEWRCRLPDDWMFADPLHDGDTGWLLADRGLDGTVTPIDVRLDGVWAPELKDKGGPECLFELKKWIVERAIYKWPFWVETTMLANNDKEKKTFNRYLGIVRTPFGESLNDHMNWYINEGGWGPGNT